VVVATPAPRTQVPRVGQPAGWRLGVAIGPGGAPRQDSADHGLAALEQAATAAGATLDMVLVHDGARPLAGRALIERGIAAARTHGAAIAAIPVRDTVKVVDADGRIIATPDRAHLQHAQTPQVFRYDLLVAAYRAARAQDLSVTDDAALLEALGHPVYVYEGAASNLKITTPEDLILAEALLAAEPER
jgi:2-C-methyl-D-erythritol 4-phosphate cytidylyltransferase